MSVCKNLEVSTRRSETGKKKENWTKKRKKQIRGPQGVIHGEQIFK